MNEIGNTFVAWRCRLAEKTAKRTRHFIKHLQLQKKTKCCLIV